MEQIDESPLDATRFTAIGTALVAVVTPILAWVLNQDSATRDMAVSISLVAIPSVALVVGADVAARAYVTPGKAESKPITQPSLLSTKVAGVGAFVVALATPLLAWLLGQDETTRHAALMITQIAIPSVAFIVAIDSLARAYATRTSAALSQATVVEEKVKTEVARVVGEKLRSEVPPLVAEKLGAATPEPHFMSFAGNELLVRVTGEGQDPFSLLGARWNADSKAWQYWVSREGHLDWVPESKVDELVRRR